MPGAVATLVPLLAIFHSARMADPPATVAGDEGGSKWPASMSALTCASKHGGSVTTCPEAAVLEELARHCSAYRREIAQASTWPFDSSNLTRLLFYLIIPPLTWAGAALIENLVDWLL